METKDSFIFYRSFFEAASALPDTERLHLMDAICEFGLNHKQLELDALSKAMFCLIKPQLEANHKRWVNGNKGGRPKASEDVKETKRKPKENQKKTKAEPNKNVNVNDNVNKNEKNIDFFTPNEASIRTIKAEFPELMDYTSLVDDFKDKIANRQSKPLKDLQAGFRNYLKRGWISPYSETKQISHAKKAQQMVKQAMSKTTNPMITGTWGKIQ